MKSKICFFISNFNSSGGTERVTATVANALNALGFEVHILSIIKDEKDSFYSVDSNILISNLGFQPNSSKKNFLKICSELRKYLLINKINNLIIVETADNVYADKIVKEVAQVYSDQKIYIVEDADKANATLIKEGLEKSLKKPNVVMVA